MAEEPKDLPQGASLAASDTTTDSPPESELNDAGSAEQEEAAVAPATSETNPMKPLDETFWEDSVDASAVNLADAGTAQEGKEEEGATETAPASGDAPPAVTDSNTEIVAEKEEEGATEAAPEAGDTPAEDPPADESSGQVKAEDASQEVKDRAEEIAIENKEEGDEETATLTGEEAPAESEVTAEGEKKEGEEDTRELVAETPEDPESPTQEEAAVQDTSEVKEPEPEKEQAVSPDNAAAEATKTRWYSSKKTMMIAAGILLLILGSIGYSVVPFFRSGDTPISTFLRGKPENAYDMKFFLPLDVGYNEARFVKVTIAIELMDKGFKKQIDKNLSQLRQEVIDLLLTKSPQEVKSSQGKKLLRQEITSRLNHHFAKDCIKDTYFTELVIL